MSVSPVEIFLAAEDVASFRNSIKALGGEFVFDSAAMIALGTAYFEKYPDRGHDRNMDEVRLGYELVRICAIEKMVREIPAERKKLYATALNSAAAVGTAVDGLVRVVEAADFRGKARARAEVGPVLASAAADEDRSIRLLAIAAMTKTATVDVDRVVGLLDSADLETRTAAIEALGQSGSAAARKRLASLLADPQWRIRAAALEALAQFAPPAWRVDEVGPRILEMLADPDEFVRSRAAPLLTGWVERSNGGAATDLIVAAAPRIRCSREVLLWLCDLLLDDRSSPARSAAYLALIAATGQKMAFDSEALPLIRQVQAKAWRDWISQNARPMARPEDRPGQG